MSSHNPSNAQQQVSYEETVAENTPDTQSPESQKDRKAPSAFRTISEVAEELDVQQHVLRFWETKFSQVRPLKRGGGRRYYRPEDVALLRSIHNLLYTQGYTIKGVQKLLKEQGKNSVVQNNKPAAPPQQAPKAMPAPASGLSKNHKAVLESMLDDLRDLRKMVGSGE